MAVALRLALISLSWGAIQFVAGGLAHIIPRRVFTRSLETEPRPEPALARVAYRRVLRVHRWKDRLPEAGALFAGGFSKRGFVGRDPARLLVFIAETRRAEFSHWLAALLSLTFFLWNTPAVAIWMPPVGLAGNAPFIVVQRYVRMRLRALLAMK
ncbi:MAG: hypothetical protein ACOC1U_01510 [Spirochaetota bacterium]